ncbi:MAG: M23 family metallopeptidase [Anaerolineae bacterium]|nr:M23 family metallopeptidase [Anaerolineae bacterium]
MEGRRRPHLWRWSKRVRTLINERWGSRDSDSRRYALHVAILVTVSALWLLPKDTSSLLAISLPQKPEYLRAAVALDDQVLASRGVRQQAVVRPRMVLDRLAVVRTTEGRYPQYEPSLYVVQPGDTLSAVAQAFGLSQKTLIWANESLVQQQDLLSVGQQLVILPMDGALHRVAEGDTLQSVAEKYRVSPDDIARYPGNVLEADQRLVVGALLVVPNAYLPDPPARVVPTAVPARPVVQQAKVAEPAPGTGALIWPLSGLITQGYSGYHPAIDIHTKAGVPVVAADAGTVTLVSWQNYGYGYHVIVDHGGGRETLYAHLSAISVEAGEVVKQGQEVGAVGSTGRSTGPHLHFEVRQDGVHRNPFSYLP